MSEQRPEDRELGGEPAPAGATDADEPGAGEGSPGGAVPGEIGIGEAVSDPGGADLGGDADIGDAKDDMRRRMADSDDAA